MSWRMLIRICVLTAVLGGTSAWAEVTNVVVIISPHNESIRTEFQEGFSRWHSEHFGSPAKVDWRDVGGTTEALRFVSSEFASKPGGIGIDIFFGGGPEPYLFLADKGLVQAYRPPAEVMAGIPQNHGGVEIYDPEFRWFGAALSSFGILENTRVQRLTGLPFIEKWIDLTRPELFGWVGAGDPRKSGSMNTMYETLLQFYGWEKGWDILNRIGGNVRRFDLYSTSTAKDVTLGETAYGLAIDFYGFTQVAIGGRTNVAFVLPKDFTALNADGIAILKGAPNLLTAQRFIDFTLGVPGQKLWFVEKGRPGGAVHESIDRMCVRPAFYTELKDVSNIQFSPFELESAFHYDSQLARERRDVVAALIGALLVDTHDELKQAWSALLKRGSTAEDLARFATVPITEAAAMSLAKNQWKNPAIRTRLKIDWQSWAQEKYRKIAKHE
jgi:iron(III) transport system substrate-binding protein